MFYKGKVRKLDFGNVISPRKFRQKFVIDLRMLSLMFKKRFLPGVVQPLYTYVFVREMLGAIWDTMLIDC